MDQARAPLQLHGHLAVLAGLLVGHGEQLAFAGAGGQHGHGDAHGGTPPALSTQGWSGTAMCRCVPA